MSKEQAEHTLREINKTTQLERDIKTLVIDWETDINKIDLTKLRTKFHNLGEIKGIDFLDLPISGFSCDFFIDDPMTDLVEFIKKGNKIIPPLWSENIKIEDGIIKNINCVLFDGNHRATLAHKLKYKKMPRLVFENRQYYFTLNKWLFSLNNNLFTVKSINEDLIFEFETEKNDIYLEGAGSQSGVKIIRNIFC